MPSLAQLLDLDRVLSAAIQRAEQHTPHAPLPRHVPRKHAALVEAPHAVKTALSRFLVWHSYLRSRKPTKASMERAAHRARGQMLWRMGILAQQQGIPAQREIPAFALQPPQMATRAAGDDNADAPTWWDDNWGDIYGDDFDFSTIYDPTVRELTPEEKKALYDDISQQLDFSDWIEGTFLQDLQVLQILESFWNGQTVNAAGQDFLDSAGIVGDFNILDQNMLLYLQRSSGMLVTRINEMTRQQLGYALWEGLGGDGGAPLAMQGLSRYIQDQMSAWNNKLAGMSDTRAQLIAVTETARAESFGNFIAMLQSGVQNKIWVVTAGACQFCLTNMEQGDVPILEPFPTGVMSPPQHPRCRCACTAAISSGFDPNQWAYTPNPAQLDSIMSNPSWGLWPQWVADLELPANKLVSASEATLVNADNLPDALLKVLSPDVIQNIGERLGTAIADINMDRFMQQFAALQQVHQAPPPLTPEEMTPAVPLTPSQEAALVQTIDDLLAQAGEADAEIQQSVQEQIQASKLDDILRELRGDEGE